MTTSVKILGVKETVRFLNSKEKKLKNSLVPQGLKNAGIFLQGEVKQSIAGRKAEPRSVDTGRFLNSVDTKLKGKDQAVVFSNLRYAKFLEFGTSSTGARKHFNNSKNRNKQAIREILNKFIKRI